MLKRFFSRPEPPPDSPPGPSPGPAADAGKSPFAPPWAGGTAAPTDPAPRGSVGDAFAAHIRRVLAPPRAKRAQSSPASEQVFPEPPDERNAGAAPAAPPTDTRSKRQRGSPFRSLFEPRAKRVPPSPPPFEPLDARDRGTSPSLATTCETPESAPTKKSKPARRSTRFEPLDVLRGLAVLGMALSGMVPSGTLPPWMYHAQLPPPTGAFNDKVYGITWVDLVFPFFLFSMGAAIPLSLGGRLDHGQPLWRVAVGLLERGLLIGAYALIGQHLRPYAMTGSPNPEVWILALAGFVFIGLMLFRWPDRVPAWVRIPLTAVGWAGALLIIANWTYPDGTIGFANYRNDVILLVLANVAVSGGLIWLFTQRAAKSRWVCFGIVAAIFLTADRPGLGNLIWTWDPTNYFGLRGGPYSRFLPILYHFEFHKYLLIVIPGTFIGDLLRGHGATRIAPVTTPFGALWAELALAVVGPVSCVVACTGLLAREVVDTTLTLAAIVVGVWFLISRFPRVQRGLPARLFLFGAPLLLVGLLCEPLGGGIRKDEPTFSYFLVTGGLGAILLCSLSCVWIGLKRNWIWRIVSDTGINPIMGYLVITNLTTGLAGITGLEAMVNAATNDPNQLLEWACVKTLFVAVATMIFTRLKVFLRA